MRACCGYVSQTLRQARIDSGLMPEELFAKWGLKDDCGNLAHAENGNRACLTNICTVTWTVSVSRLSLSVLVLLIGIPSPVLTPWSECSKKSASRCIGGSGKKLLNKSLLALLIHLFILFLQ